MKLTVSKNSFLNYLVTPVSKIAEHLPISFCKEQNQSYIKSITNSNDNSVIFLSKVEASVENPSSIIIPDCKTFLRLLSNIETPNLILNFTSNCIEYKNDSLEFKYHLLDESYFSTKKSISEEKLSQIPFDTNFLLPKTKLTEIIKFNTIIPEAEKLYFFTKGGKVYTKIGDEQKLNTNQISFEVANSFKGNETESLFPINIQNLLLFSFVEDQINVSINQSLKIFKFETNNISYIVSGLVK